MSWSPHRVAEITRVVTKGTTPTTLGRAFTDSGVNFIKAEALNGDSGLNIAGFSHVDDDTHELLARSVLQEDDILVTIAGAHVGKCGFVKAEHLPANTNQAVGIVRVNKEKAVPRFIYYFFKHPNTFALCQGLGGQAAQPNVNLTVLKSITVNLPSPAVQSRVAEILSAYDDLIENNRRRMALLEDAARQLYREWFVRLRFPGHEHTCINNGVPEGWHSQVLDELCDIGRGASPRPIAAFMGGDVPWFKIGDATASESPFIFRTQDHVTQDGAKKSMKLDPGALILSNSATCGIPYFTAVAGCVHDGWLYFSDFKRPSREFLYCFLYFKRQELVSSVGDGSTQKNLNIAAVGRLKVILPRNDSLLAQFDDTVSPIFSMILNLATQNERLRAVRDLLLPRLMSGKIAV